MVKNSTTPNNSLKMEFTPNEALFTFRFPVKEIQLTEEELDHKNDVMMARLADLLGSFAPRMIEALQARMESCRQKLIEHMSTAYSPHMGCICWQRKDGTTDHFFQASYEAMERGIKFLSNGQWMVFLKDIAVVDQTLKGLLNMPELDHSDCGGFRFSELVSALMENLTVPAAAFNNCH